jgi:hypothetical protein
MEPEGSLPCSQGLSTGRYPEPDQLLRPPVLPNRVTGAAYHRFLANGLSVLLEHVPLHKQYIRFMHDGTPPHFLRIVRHHLNQTFGDQWIGRGGPVNWPARTPDLNPLVAVGTPKGFGVT